MFRRPAVHLPPAPGDLAATVHRLSREVRRLDRPLGRVPTVTSDPPDVDVWVRTDTGQLCYRAAGVVHRLGP